MKFSLWRQRKKTLQNMITYKLLHIYVYLEIVGYAAICGYSIIEMNNSVETK